MVNSSSEVVCPLLQEKKAWRQNRAAVYFMLTALCGCVRLPRLVCDIDPLPFNQTTGFGWRREASEITNFCKVETQRCSAYYKPNCL